MSTNLGALTEIAALGDAAEITEEPGHLVVRCRSMPTFYWGNYLLLDRAPAADEIDRWLATFAATFGDDPRIGHVAIGWQDHAGDEAAVKRFAERGYQIDDCAVTTLDVAPPARALPDGMTIEPAGSDADWRDVIELAMASREERHTAEAYRAYLEGVCAQRRAEADKGRLRWYLARLDGQVVGDMGIYIVAAPPPGLPADGIERLLPIARFQAVKTHPDFRRRGVCSALLTTVCREALGPLGIRRLVLLVDEQGPAWGIYRRHGFRPVGRLRGVWRPPPGDWIAEPGD